MTNCNRPTPWHEHHKERKKCDVLFWTIMVFFWLSILCVIMLLGLGGYFAYLLLTGAL